MIAVSVLAQLQEARREWVLRNFPDSIGDGGRHNSLGIAEEFGELCHAILKAEQKIRGTAEEHEAKAKDAIGDLIVFLAGWCDDHGVDLAVAITRHPVTSSRIVNHLFLPLTLGRYIGRLMAIQETKMEGASILEYNKSRIPARIIHWLDQYCEQQGWSLTEIVADTWTEVSKRDWTKNHVDGTIS